MEHTFQNLAATNPRPRRGHVTQRLMVAGIMLMSSALAACGAESAATHTPATSQGAAAPASLPNLADPATRQRFVCSFATGSFGVTATAARDTGCPADVDASKTP